MFCSRASMSNSEKTKMDYLRTLQGQWGRYYWRKMHSRSLYPFDIEPKSKKAMKTDEKTAFQQKILKQMKSLGKRAYRGQIVAELSISSTSENPPHVHTAIKNFLDLFSVPLPESGIKRKGLIYQDDKQIAYLSVDYHIGKERPKIFASFAPFRHFLLDLALAQDIISGEYNNYFDHDDFIKEIDDRYEYTAEDIIWDELRDLKRNKDKWIQRFGKAAYDGVLRMNQVLCQEFFLKRGSLSIGDIHTLYSATGKISKIEDIVFPELKTYRCDLSSHLAKWIINSPARTQLSRVPDAEYETQQFKQAVGRSLREYRKKHKILDPLRIPVTLQAIYKPPPVSQGLSTDLDNIMSVIISLFHEEFRPPPTSVSNMDLNNISDEGLLERIKPWIRALPKSVKYSVSGYEIFRVPRHPKDHDDGFICIGISAKVPCVESLWRKIDKIISRWRRSCERSF